MKSITCSLLGLVLLGGISFFLASGKPHRDYRAESLLAVRRFDDAFLQPAFERLIIRSTPGITRLGFQVSTFIETSLKGTRRETNGIIRLVVAGLTPEEAERIAKRAAEGVRAILQQRYGATATVLGQPHSFPASAAHEPFRLRFGRAATGPFPSTGRVLFTVPGISIDPGGDWTRGYVVGRETGCDPSLTGLRKFNGAFINARWLGLSYSNVASGVALLRGHIAQEQGLIESSVKEQPFTGDSGLQGAELSFVKQYPAPIPRGGGMMLMTQATHYYIVTNALSRCAVLEYFTVSGSVSEEVQEMIRRTLRADSTSGSPASSDSTIEKFLNP